MQFQSIKDIHLWVSYCSSTIVKLLRMIIIDFLFWMAERVQRIFSLRLRLITRAFAVSCRARWSCVFSLQRIERGVTRTPVVMGRGLTPVVSAVNLWNSLHFMSSVSSSSMTAPITTSPRRVNSSDYFGCNCHPFVPLCLIHYISKVKMNVSGVIRGAFLSVIIPISN